MSSNLTTSRTSIHPTAPILRGGKRATRLAFFIAGFAIACWAPLVPFAQARMNADAAELGTILLCLGLGAVIGMPAAGALSARIGSRFVIMAGAAGLVISLPLLAFLSGPFMLGACLTLFGAAIGAIDVAANIHGTEVQEAAGVPLMSGFHGFYSVGGLAGASGMTLLIALGVDILFAASMAAALVLLCIVVAAPGFFTARSTDDSPLFIVPHGVVVAIGILALIVFLAEGAMLDWVALLLTQVKQVDVSISGIGYTLFAAAMTISRLAGDRIVTRVGERSALLAGLALTGLGIVIIALAVPVPAVLAGIVLAGLAAGNVVPVLFTLAGRQKAMPASHAIAAASMLGYFGILMGPALIGYVAYFIGLAGAFAAMGAILFIAMIVVPAITGARAMRGS
ncbi:Fucose permease [Sphingobium faniae]|nr:Fucose permease [Sphingobium faniae]